MMDCNKAEKLLVEYLYQELSPEKTLLVEKHLEACDACAKTLHNWRGIHRGFQRSNDVPQPAPFLKTRILAAAKQELGRKTPLMERILVFLKPAVLMPILIFAVLIVWFLPMKHMQMSEIRPASTPAETSSKTILQKPTAPPAAPAKEQPAPSITKAEAEKLKALGYINGGKSNESVESRLDQPKNDESNTAQPADQLAGGRTENYDRERDQQQVAPQYKEEAAKEPSAAIEYEAPGAERAKLQTPVETKTGSLDDKRAAAGAPAPAAMQNGQLSKAAPAGKDADNFIVAQQYFQKGDLSNGKKVADELIRNDKSQSRAADFDQTGRAYQARGATQLAILQYNLLLNNYPGYPQSSDVLLRLGECYEQIGEYDKASTTYRQLQQVSTTRELATEKLRTLSKKKQVQEQLRSLGYVNEKDKQ